MRLDVIVPTYNRQSSLERTLSSLFAATVPADMNVCVTVVDNNSFDCTNTVVQNWQRVHGDALSYIFEPKQGRSHALNAGIKATSGDLVGFIDDDEEIESRWYECAHNAFSKLGVDFVGGPYLPRWEIAPPQWISKKYCGVIGWIDGGDEVLPFDENYPGILMGGNAIISRATLKKTGLYRTCISRNGNKLLAGEDEDMYRRLLKANAKGLYLPELKIFHHIPANRLTKSYHRKWCFWRGVSSGVLDHIRRENCAYLFGVPRHLFGKAVRGVLDNVRSVIYRKKDPATLLDNELAIWDLLGFFYGRHLYRDDAVSDTSVDSL